MFYFTPRDLVIFGLFVFCSAAPAAQVCNDAIAATAPDSRYQDNGDGTVTDLATGLIWKQCAEGLRGAGCDSGSPDVFTWQQALQRAENAVFAGSSQWRLPNKNELVSLVERSCYGPAINERYFPNTRPDSFWSSSSYAFARDYAWFVYFEDGAVYGAGVKPYPGYVRLVRGGGSDDPIAPGNETDVYLSTDRGSIYIWNMISGDLRLAAETSLALKDIAFAPDGRLFAITPDKLYRIDLQYGSAAEIGALRSDDELYSGVSELTDANGFDISPTGIGRISSGNNSIVAFVDLETGRVSNEAGWLPSPYGGSKGDLWYTTDVNYSVATKSATIAHVRPASFPVPVVGEVVESTQVIGSSVDGLITAPEGAEMVIPGTLVGFVGTTVYDLGPRGLALGPGVATLDLDGFVTGATVRR